ncbi:MAG TPA: FAD-dependent monooxygenase, partial [bacterium]
TTEADFIIAADGAVSRMAKQVMGRQLNSVIAIQDEFKVSQDKIDALENRCLFNYSPAVSPDFYGWIFPKDGTVSIGIGTDLNQREKANGFLERMKEIHKEFIDGGTHTKRNGAMIPMEQYKLHGYKRVLLTGDSAGLVLPAAGEGIYFAMRSGEIAANAISEFSKERPDLVVQKYTDRVNSEFGPIFKYWMRVQNVAYKSTFNRETFVRLASDKFMGQKILKAFASKSYVPTPIAKRMQILMYLLSIRANVYFHSSREPDFGK